MLVGWLLLGLLVVFLLKGIRDWWLDVNTPGLPPGDKGLPFFYNFLQIWKNKHRIYDFTLERSMQYKSTVWTGRLLGVAPRSIVVADPRCVEYILKDNWQNYVKGPYFCSMLLPLFGEGIFNVNGTQWKQQRQTASHLFTVKELRAMVDVFSKHALELAELLLKTAEQGKEVEIQDLISRATLDSIGVIAFGENIDSLHKDAPFAMAFNQAQLSIDARAFFPFWRWMPWIKSERQLRNSLEILDSFAYRLIDSRKKDPAVSEKKDLLSRYILMKDEHDKPFTDKYLRDMIMNFLIAGRDTTAQCLMWTFYLLAKNPRVEDKLVKEIDTELNGATPDFEDLKRLKYLQAVIDESLRLFPPVPIDPKMALEDDTLPNGYKVKAGYAVEWNQWVMGHHPNYWDCPDEFRPERWESEANNGGKPVPRGNQPPFIPFQYGPRTCLGINFAYTEVKVVLVLLLQRLRMRLVPGHVVQYKSAITISALNGIRMTVEPRPGRASSKSE